MLLYHAIHSQAVTNLSFVTISFILISVYSTFGYVSNILKKTLDSIYVNFKKFYDYEFLL